MNLLVHEGKHEHQYILFQPGVDEGEAWLAMFRIFNEWEQFYDDIDDFDDPDSTGDLRERTLYHLAKQGNRGCAKRLLLDRSGGEYESVYIISVSSPADLFRILDNEKTNTTDR